MTRKETMIVAALINAGLLVILFVTATNQTEEVVCGDKPAASVASITAVNDVQEKTSLENSEELVIGSTVDVIVRRGDQLDKIALAYNTTPEVLAKINHLNSSQLVVGQLLKVPANKSMISSNEIAIPDAATEIVRSTPVETQRPASKPKAVKSDLATSTKFYVVKKGDSPWSIAHKHKMKVEDLLQMNNLDDKKARKLKAGDKLKVK